MADSILEGIVEHIATCPLLQDGVFRVDALGDQAVEYTIETGVFDPVIKRYVNGDEVKQYQFNLILGAESITPWIGSRISRTAHFMRNSQIGSRIRTVKRFFRIFRKIAMRRR